MRRETSKPLALFIQGKQDELTCRKALTSWLCEVQTCWVGRASPCQPLPAPASRCQPLPAPANPCQPLPVPASPRQPLPAPASHCQPLLARRLPAARGAGQPGATSITQCMAPSPLCAQHLQPSLLGDLPAVHPPADTERMLKQSSGTWYCTEWKRSLSEGDSGFLTVSTCTKW